MRKERTLNVARALASQLHVTEEAIDSALSEAAHLIDAYVTARRAIRMSPVISGDVHENTLKAMMALSQAQQHLTAAHNGLSLIQNKIGLANAVITPPETGKDAPPPHDGGVTSWEQPGALTT